ncbi:MAG TPA: hypothetical protein VI756_27040 [Blastocatellia bacterium]
MKYIKSRGEYHRMYDFWKPLRERIVECHRSHDHDRGFMDGVLTGLTDAKKKTADPELVKMYKRFIGNKHFTYSTAPKVEWHHGRLRVRINPEMILTIGDQRVIIKLYFKAEPLSGPRVSLIHVLMASTLENKLPAGTDYGLLEVRRNKLYTTAEPNFDLLPSLAGEAENFITIWNALP